MCLHWEIFLFIHQNHVIMKEYLIVTVSVLCIFLLLTCIGLMNIIKPKINDTEFQFVVTDSMMSVYNNDMYVGTVRVQGQLDSLLVDYNQ